ncbi:hypothetical protein ACQ4PT_043428 [Festuca glaucescens]
MAKAIAENLPACDAIESASVAGPGFVNIVLSNTWIAKRIQDMLVHGIKTWAPIMPVKRVVLDFSSPNIAKEMHVGHLRSTTSGETLARMLEFSNVDVLRRNHVGDWGTQFGMLIEFLFEKFPNWEELEVRPLVTSSFSIKHPKKDSIMMQNLRLGLTKLWFGYREGMRNIVQLGKGYAARMAGWLPDPNEKKFPKTSHVGLGLVLGADGKLVDWTDEELDKTSKELGYGAVKYADLKNNRLTNYTFSFDQMLSIKGNTAVYLQYAHARICSIIGKSNMDVEDLKMNASISLGHPDERALGLHLIRFAEVVEEACTELLPSVLCDYLYNLSEMFMKFYTSCQVLGSDEEPSRVLLCEATVIVMQQTFQLLGITPVYKL